METPENARLWTGITLLGSLLRRQVWLEYAYQKLFPNLYTFIIGPSGEGKKSTVVEIGLEIIKDVDSITLVQQKITAEALLTALNHYDKRLLAKGRFVSDGSVLIFSPELKVFLGAPKNAQTMVAVLTEMYGCQEKFPYITKEHGSFHIANVCPTWLACSTPDWLSSVPADAIDGGFMARILIIHVPKRQKFIAWPVREKEHFALRKTLIEDADYISHIEGEFSVSDGARDYFTKWYEQEWGPKMPEDEKLIPFHNRAHVYALKLAMILTVDVGDDLTITEAALRKSVDMIMDLQEGTRTALSYVGTENIGGRDQKRIVEYLQKAGGKLDHSSLLRKVRWRGITPEVLFSHMRHLDELGVIDLDYGPPKIYTIKLSDEDIKDLLG